MSTDELKPLSFNDFEENNETLQPLTFGEEEKYTSHEEESFLPLNGNANRSGYDKDSNYVFFFGTAESGKSVILSSMLYYLSSEAGVLRPKLGTPNTREAQGLLTDFFENIRRGILPNRTTRDQVTRLDLVFEPNNRSAKVPPINLTFLETSGENHNEIRRGGSYHSSIEAYLNANIPLTFIIVTSYDTAHRDDTLINEFLDKLELKGKNIQSLNLILVISKWDKSGNIDVASAEELDSFVSERLSRTNQRINTYGLSKTFYTIGNITKNEQGTERIAMLSLATAEVLSKWLYESIVGYPLDYPGTFWERIKFGF